MRSNLKGQVRAVGFRPRLGDKFLVYSIIRYWRSISDNRSVPILCFTHQVTMIRYNRVVLINLSSLVLFVFLYKSIDDKLSDDEMERDNSSVILVNGHISGDTSGSDSSESLDESCRPLDLNDDSSVQRVGRRKKKKVTTRSHIVTAGHRSPIPLERHVIVDIGNVEGDLKEAKLIDISTPVPPLITPTPSEEEDQNQVLTMPNQQNTTILITKQLSEVDLTT